jgi:hypothetical protein
MAVLSDPDRLQVAGDYMSDASSLRTAIPVTKLEVRATVNAIDDWVEANQAAFNLAIPQPARGALTPKEKAALLMYVVQKRYKVL